MSAALVATLSWFVAANLAAMLPTRGNRWRRASALVALGVPLLGWLTITHGPVAGLVALAAGASVLRWPLILLLRRLRGEPRREPAE